MRRRRPSRHTPHTLRGPIEFHTKPNVVPSACAPATIPAHPSHVSFVAAKGASPKAQMLRPFTRSMPP
eukprot:4682037-Pyramimonas_sp.AAC.1